MALKRIGIDVENGDVVDGKSVTERMAPAIKRFVSEYPDVKVFLHGNRERMTAVFDDDILYHVQLVPASEFYDQSDKITRPVPGSVLNNLAVAVHKGAIDGYFSIGDTSKVVFEATKIKTKGIKRSLVMMLPSINGSFACSDVGLGVPTSSKTFYSGAVDGWAREIYMQGLMASVYVRDHGIIRPRWGIMSNGTEDHKGTDIDNHLDSIIQKAMKTVHLEEIIEYKGKIEPADCFNGNVDIALTDGYKGNLFLKTLKATYDMMGTWIKEEVNNIGQLEKVLLLPASGLIDRAKENFKSKISAEKYNGAVVLGYDSVIIKGHGNSNSEFIYAGLCNLADCTSGDAGEEMVKAVTKYMPKK